MLNIQIQIQIVQINSLLTFLSRDNGDSVISLVFIFPNPFLWFYIHEYIYITALSNLLNINYILYIVLQSVFSPYYLCIYLAMPGLSCGNQDLQSSLRHAGSSSLTRDQIRAPCIGVWSLSHWTSREVPAICFFFLISFRDQSHRCIYLSIHVPFLCVYV